jgi:hypothetical protein
MIGELLEIVSDGWLFKRLALQLLNRPVSVLRVALGLQVFEVEPRGVMNTASGSSARNNAHSAG